MNLSGKQIDSWLIFWRPVNQDWLYRTLQAIIKKIKKENKDICKARTFSVQIELTDFLTPSQPWLGIFDDRLQLMIKILMFCFALFFVFVKARTFSVKVEIGACLNIKFNTILCNHHDWLSVKNYSRQFNFCIDCDALLVASADFEEQDVYGQIF